MENHNEIREQEGAKAVSAVQETPEHVLEREEVQEGFGARPVPAVPQEPGGLGLAGAKRTSLKARATRALIWVAALGPTAVIIADRVAHFFGICLGH